jgi:hypothetical protein
LNHLEMDCRDENLLALCQKCHLAMDQEIHQSRRRTRLRGMKAHKELFEE